MKVDLYEKLEVSPDAADEQIKESYRVLAKMYHPDNHVNSTEKVKQMASKKFNEIRVAYKTLSDENLRLKYDRRRLGEQKKYANDDLEVEYYEDEHIDEDGYHPNEHAYAEHEEQLDDAILAFRQGLPRIFKVAAVFVGVLGWIMFISFAFGNWGSYYSEEQSTTEPLFERFESLMAENDLLRQQLRQASQQSLQLEQSISHYVQWISHYEQWISEMIVEINDAQNMRSQLESLQSKDWYDYYRQQVDSLTASLFTARYRLGLVEQELEDFIVMALNIHALHLEMLAAIPGVPDALFTELWYQHGELLDNLQRLKANLAVGAH